MLKKHMAACLFATAFVAAPALATTTPAPSGGTDRPAASASGSATTGSSAMQPAPAPAAPSAGGSSTMGSSSTAAPSTAASGGATTGTSGSSSGAAVTTAGSSGGAAQGTFVTQLQGEQMMASKLIGTAVVSANNESIGDVNDVIMDRQGKAMAVVIGVGGFLGIGEKDVAISFDKLDFNPPQQTAAANTNPPAGGPAAGSSGANNNAAATTGSTAGAGAGSAANRPATTGGNANREGGVPDRIMLRMTKAELQAAPTFRASGNNNAGNNNNNAGANTAPKQ